MPQATISTLYDIAQGYSLIPLLQKISEAGQALSQEFTDLLQQLKTADSELNIKHLNKLHLAIGTPRGEYNGHHDEHEPFQLPLFKSTFPSDSPSKENLLEQKVALCYYLFAIYSIKKNERQDASLDSLLAEIKNKIFLALNDFFVYSNSLLTPSRTHTTDLTELNSVKKSLLTMLCMRLVMIKKDKKIKQQPITSAQTSHVINIHYTSVKHTDKPKSAFYNWITANSEVFGLFQTVATALGSSDAQYQLPWEFILFCLNSYAKDQKNLTVSEEPSLATDESPSDPILNGLLDLLNKSPITVETSSHGKVKYKLRDPELFVHPEYFEPENTALLYKYYLSNFFTKSSNKIKITFLKAILMNPEGTDPLVKFLSSSKKGIQYFCKLVADYSLLTRLEEEASITFTPLKNSDSLKTEDLILDRPITDDTIDIPLAEKYAKESNNKKTLRQKIVDDKNLSRKVSNIRKAIDPTTKTLLSTVFFTQRHKGFFAQTPSVDNSRSQVSKLNAELPLTEKELAIAFFKAHDLPVPVQLQKDFIDLQFDSDDLPEGSESKRDSTLELPEANADQSTSRESSFILTERLPFWRRNYVGPSVDDMRNSVNSEEVFRASSYE